jgi:hypothetical protein
MIGPDNNLYIPIGDVDGSFNKDRWETRAQNYVNATQPDGRGGILKITIVSRKFYLFKVGPHRDRSTLRDALAHSEIYIDLHYGLDEHFRF